MTRKPLLVASSLATSVFLVTGCSSLPEFSNLEQRLRLRDTVPLEIVGKDGLLMGDVRARVEKQLLQGSSSSQRHLQIMQAASESPIVVGNTASILLDGPKAYDAIFTAILLAKHHIHIESFIFEELEFHQILSDLLIKKRAQGVAIRILYDSYGSKETPTEFFAKLREAKIEVCEFNPVNPFRARVGWALNHRDHRKIVVVDGLTAFTGGINFHQVYRTDSAPTKIRKSMPTIVDGWRDTHLKIQGPAVPQFQQLFLDSWEKQSCGPIAKAQDAYFPSTPEVGGDIMSVVGSSPNGMLSRMYLTLLAAITNADRSIYLTAAYFIPDPNTILALTAATKRGVDVRLLLPGISDSWLAFHGGRSHYDVLLKAGVRIYERPDALLHAKTVVVDGAWATVGSSNIDWRSFCHNDEVNAIVIGQDFGARMNKVFDDDLMLATEITAEEWDQRGATIRLLETLARQWEYIL